MNEEEDEEEDEFPAHRYEVAEPGDWRRYGRQRQAARDGRMCDDCGQRNWPAGWLARDWARYVPFPDTFNEGYTGLVLCLMCFCERVKLVDGPAVALEELQTMLREHVRRTVSRGDHGRRPRPGPSAPGHG